ncbi:BRCT domain-containing protein [Mesorhizobium sp. M0622]|uniref:BRCT domain-containing protein n=1 Tax=Mesorhizobium sp. M0622 TaxID=2956975 RepID=UPI003339DDB1
MEIGRRAAASAAVVFALASASCTTSQEALNKNPQAVSTSALCRSYASTSDQSFRDNLYTELARRSVTPQQCADMIRKQNQAIAAGVAIAAVGAAIAVCSNNNCGGGYGRPNYYQAPIGMNSTTSTANWFGRAATSLAGSSSTTATATARRKRIGVGPQSTHEEWVSRMRRREVLVDDRFYNRVGGDRISSRQVDELIGLARGLAADGTINKAEVEFLQKWLAANAEISNQPLIRTLYGRINDILADGVLDSGEHAELLDTLNSFSNRDFELGEVLKPTTLPLCRPAPTLTFAGRLYCFTGTFNFGQRKHCEQAIADRGGFAGGLSQKTEILVIGAYATESWKHSSFGDKIVKATDWRDQGLPISIVAESHWASFL